MKNVLQIFLDDQSSIEIEVVIKKTNDTFLKVHELQEYSLPLFLEIEHKHLNTVLELTKVHPYVLLYFDVEDGSILFKGASFNLNESDKPFAISSQYKKILFLHYPVPFKLHKISHLALIS